MIVFYSRHSYNGLIQKKEYLYVLGVDKIMKENIRAFILGVIVIAIVSWLSLWGMDTFKNGYIGLLSLASPLIGAFITSAMATSRKLILSTLLAMPTAIILGIENSIWQLLGKGSDFPGYKGFVTLVGLQLITSIILCSIGGLLGLLASKKRPNLKQ